MSDEGTTEIREFSRGDDATYEAWVNEHAGYVLTQRSEDFMLHVAGCGHLQLTPGRWSLTTRPRRCAQSR